MAVVENARIKIIFSNKKLDNSEVAKFKHIFGSINDDQNLNRVLEHNVVSDMK